MERRLERPFEIEQEPEAPGFVQEFIETNGQYFEVFRTELQALNLPRSALARVLRLPVALLEKRG